MRAEFSVSLPLRLRNVKPHQGSSLRVEARGALLMSTAEKVDSTVNLFGETRLENTNTPTRRLARFAVHAQPKRRRPINFPSSPAMAHDEQTGAVKKPARGRPKKITRVASPPAKRAGKLHPISPRVSKPGVTQGGTVLQGDAVYDVPVNEDEDARAASKLDNSAKVPKGRKNRRLEIEDGSEDSEAVVVTHVKLGVAAGHKEPEKHVERNEEHQFGEGEVADNAPKDIPEIQNSSEESQTQRGDASVPKASGQSIDDELRNAIPSEDEGNQGLGGVDRTTATVDDKEITYLAAEMFGQEDTWKGFVHGVLRIRIDGAKFKKLNFKEVECAEDLIDFCREAYAIYSELARDKHPADVEVDLRTRLEKATRNIEAEVNTIEKRPQKGDKAKLKDPVYRAMVYEMGILVMKAHAVDTTRYSQSDSIKVLQRMVQLQELMISLCEKATAYYGKSLDKGKRRQWSIKEVILAKLKEVLVAFEAELTDRNRRRSEEIKQKALEIAKLKKAQDQRLRDEHIRECQRRALEDIARNQAELGGSTDFKTKRQKLRPRSTKRKAFDDEDWVDLRDEPDEEASTNRTGMDADNVQSTEILSQIPKTKTQAKPGWNNDNDEELLQALMRYGHLPGTCLMPGHLFQLGSETANTFLVANERYNQVLSIQNFQNKNDELIRERALFYKPLLETTYQENGKPVPDWVTSLE